MIYSINQESDEIAGDNGCKVALCFLQGCIESHRIGELEINHKQGTERCANGGQQPKLFYESMECIALHVAG